MLLLVSSLLHKTRDLFARSDDPTGDELQADDTAPGVKLIKQVWKIGDEKPLREKAPKDVAHDIYHVPDIKRDVPSRPPGRVRR
jgi:hypothetical protein